MPSPKIELEAFCLIHQQENMRRRDTTVPPEDRTPSWTLSYRLKGDTGYHIHIISEAYAGRLMKILQGEPDEGGFNIPALSNKIYSPEDVARSLVRAVKSTDLALAAQKAVPERTALAATEARERLSDTILAGIA